VILVNLAEFGVFSFAAILGVADLELCVFG